MKPPVKMLDNGDFDSLCEWLVFRKIPCGGIVAVDGATGSGKTSIVMRLAKKFDAIRVSLDSYIRPERNCYYVDCLELEFLRDDIYRFRSKFPMVFVEGICVQDVLQRSGFRWDSRVYVKKIGSNELWHFSFHLDDYMAGKLKSEDQKQPWLSDYDYHSRFKPHEDSGFTYIRVSD